MHEEKSIISWGRTFSAQLLIIDAMLMQAEPTPSAGVLQENTLHPARYNCCSHKKRIMMLYNNKPRVLPRVSQDVEAYVPVRVDVRVHGGCVRRRDDEHNLGRLERVFGL